MVGVFVGVLVTVGVGVLVGGVQQPKLTSVAVPIISILAGFEVHIVALAGVAHLDEAGLGETEPLLGARVCLDLVFFLALGTAARLGRDLVLELAHVCKVPHWHERAGDVR